MPLPLLGWAAVAIGTAVAGYVVKEVIEDNNSSSTSSSREAEEARTKAIEKSNKIVIDEVENTRVEAVKKFKAKYDEDLKFSYEKSNGFFGLIANSQLQTLNNYKKNEPEIIKIQYFSKNNVSEAKLNIDTLKASVEYKSIKAKDNQKSILEMNNTLLKKLKQKVEEI